MRKVQDFLHLFNINKYEFQEFQSDQYDYDTISLMRNVLRRTPTSFLLRINTTADCHDPICPCLEWHVDALRNGFQLLFASQAYWVAFVYRPHGLLRILIAWETFIGVCSECRARIRALQYMHQPHLEQSKHLRVKMRLSRTRNEIPLFLKTFTQNVTGC